jgi:hypothetical protein
MNLCDRNLDARYARSIRHQTYAAMAWQNGLELRARYRFWRAARCDKSSAVASGTFLSAYADSVADAAVRLRSHRLAARNFRWALPEQASSALYGALHHEYTVLQALRPAKQKKYGDLAEAFARLAAAKLRDERFVKPCPDSLPDNTTVTSPEPGNATGPRS